MNQEIIAPFRSDMTSQQEQTNGRVSTKESIIPVLVKMEEFKCIQFPVWAYGVRVRAQWVKRGGWTRSGEEEGQRFPFLLLSQGKSEASGLRHLIREYFFLFLQMFSQKTHNIRIPTRAVAPILRRFGGNYPGGVNDSLPSPYRLHH